MWCSKNQAWCYEIDCQIDCLHCEHMVNAAGDSYYEYEDTALDHVAEYIKRKKGE